MQNDPQHFPDLRKSELERFANRWVENYPDIPIEQIKLYHYHSKWADICGNRYPAPGRRQFLYIIAFEISELDLSPYKTKAEIVRGKDGLAIRDPLEREIERNVLSSLPEREWDIYLECFEFEVSLPFLFLNLSWRTFLEKFDNLNHPYPKNPFVYKGFDSVYCNAPDHKFYRDWYFHVGPPGELPKNATVKPTWVLLSNAITLNDQPVEHVRAEIPFDVLFAEADRCYKVYGQLKKDEKLSVEIWRSQIDQMCLNSVSSGDVVGISIHQEDKKNIKRNITFPIIQNALKRIDPSKNYTSEDLESLKKQLQR